MYFKSDLADYVCEVRIPAQSSFIGGLRLKSLIRSLNLA